MRTTNRSGTRGKPPGKSRADNAPDNAPKNAPTKAARKVTAIAPTKRAAKGATAGSGAGAGAPLESMRVAKAMARAGLCSRRDAERWIDEGRVAVNGKRLKSPAIVVGPSDKVVVDGKPLPAADETQLWRYHKPRGVVTTHRDPQERPTVFDAMPDEMPRVVSIGRLDFNTEGLLLLTNDGALARHMELPATGWLRRYRVRAYGRVTAQDIEKLKEGISIEGVNYGPIVASVDSVQGANTWLTLGLREGKNREVRRILEHLELKVNRLIRISYGPFQLLDLKPGEVDIVRRRVLMDQLGESAKGELGFAKAQNSDKAPSANAKPRGNSPKRKPATRAAK